MSLILKTDATENDSVKGEGLHAFESNMPGGASWTSGLTIDIDIRSPVENDQWETLHTFSDKGSWQTYMISGRVYRVVASTEGAWVWLNTIRERVTK